MSQDERTPISPDPEDKDLLPAEETPGEDYELPSDEEAAELQPESFPDEEENAPAQKAPYRGSRTGTLIFYTLYILLILVFAGAMLLANNSLKDWLTDYQLSQPTDKRDQVFEEFFAPADWYAVYDAAGIEDTAFEGADAFAAYMTQLVGDAPLELVETSAGLSGNRKYFIKLGGQSIASYLLTSQPDPVTGLPRWELADVDVFFQRSEDVTILIQQGQTAYVNGIPLDESFTIRMDYALASRYLPAGVYSHRSDTQYLSGLLTEPEITVLDENGQTVPVTYDPETDRYTTQAPEYPTELPESILKDVTAAAEAYGAYLLGLQDADSLTGYFDRTTDLWPVLMETTPFDPETVDVVLDSTTLTGFRQYGEDLISLEVSLRFLSTPKPETDETDEKKDDETPQPEPTEHLWSHTIFFRYDGSSWTGIGLTDEPEPKGASRVLLTFVMDGVVVSDNFHDTSLRQMVVPLVSAPEGRVFAGWYREQTEADGSITLVSVFRPDESGLVIFPDDFTLEPMTLYALFEDETTETEVTE